MKTGRALILAALTASAGCAGPYTVTRELRGHGPQKLHYVYPPGTAPAKRLRVVVPLETKPSTACAATTATSESFTLRFRRSPILAPAAVVRDRGGLPKSRGDFETEQMALVAGASSCLQDGEAQSMASRLWERLPKSFADDLWDRYRYDTANRTIDLQAGMRLRFEWQAFNFGDPITDPSLQTYTGAGTTYVMVARRPHDVFADVTSDRGLLTFEPFLSWTGTTIDRTLRPRVAGAVDLEGPALARKHYRLLLPDSFGKSAVASNRPRGRMIFIGANSSADLDTAESDVDHCVNRWPAPSEPICTAVAGRTLVVPEVVVRINGDDAYLPVGATLRQIIDRDARPWKPRTNLPLRRYYRGQLTSVRFANPEEDALDIPLAKGDRFSW